MRRERTFVLRLWSDAALGPVWRVRLEDVDSGERWTFAGLQELCRFLAPPLSTQPRTVEDVEDEDGHG